MLKTTIIDRHLDKRIEGMTGNNFSSYVRDYDFSVWLSEHNKERSEFGIPEGLAIFTASCSSVSSTPRRIDPLPARRR